MREAKRNARELADRYTYRVAWSEEDGEHVATCAEWPYLSWLAPEQGAALSGLVEVVVSEIIRRLGSGEAIPDPLSTRAYSGQFRARIPPEEHRRLAIEAAEQQVSLNRLVSMKLAR